MLYLYDNKVYVKPVEYKLVEVKVTKKGDEYNVEPTKNVVETTAEIREKLNEITLEKAYKLNVKAGKKVTETSDETAETPENVSEKTSIL